MGFYSRLSCLEDPDRCTAVICDKDNVISIRGRERIAPDALFYEVVPDYSVGFSVKLINPEGVNIFNTVTSAARARDIMATGKSTRPDGNIFSLVFTAV